MTTRWLFCPVVIQELSTAMKNWLILWRNRPSTWSHSLAWIHQWYRVKWIKTGRRARLNKSWPGTSSYAVNLTSRPILDNTNSLTRSPSNCNSNRRFPWQNSSHSICTSHSTRSPYYKSRVFSRSRSPRINNSPGSPQESHRQDT